MRQPDAATCERAGHASLARVRWARHLVGNEKELVTTRRAELSEIAEKVSPRDC